MKLTTRLKRGRKSEWWVLRGGPARHTVAEILYQMNGQSMRYCPYLHLIDTRPGGRGYTTKTLPAAETLKDAVAAVAAALTDDQPAMPE